jgi:hypothetical protein
MLELHKREINAILFYFSKVWPKMFFTIITNNYNLEALLWVMVFES